MTSILCLVILSLRILRGSEIKQSASWMQGELTYLPLCKYYCVFIQAPTTSAIVVGNVRGSGWGGCRARRISESFVEADRRNSWVKSRCLKKLGINAWGIKNSHRETNMQASRGSEQSSMNSDNQSNSSTQDARNKESSCANPNLLP